MTRSDGRSGDTNTSEAARVHASLAAAVKAQRAAEVRNAQEAERLAREATAAARAVGAPPCSN